MYPTCKAEGIFNQEEQFIENNWLRISSVQEKPHKSTGPQEGQHQVCGGLCVLCTRPVAIYIMKQTLHTLYKEKPVLCNYEAKTPGILKWSQV